MGFYGTLKMIFYKVSRKGGGDLLCPVRCCNAPVSPPARPPPPVAATRLSHGRLRGHCGGSCRGPQADAVFNPTACYAISLQRCVFSFPLLSTVTSIAIQKRHRRCSSVIQEAVASIPTRCAAPHMSLLSLLCLVNIR